MTSPAVGATDSEGHGRGRIEAAQITKQGRRANHIKRFQGPGTPVEAYQGNEEQRTQEPAKHTLGFSQHAIRPLPEHNKDQQCDSRSNRIEGAMVVLSDQTGQPSAKEPPDHEAVLNEEYQAQAGVHPERPGFTQPQVHQVQRP